MILTDCAVCAAPLAHDAPHQCVRCQLAAQSNLASTYHSLGRKTEGLRMQAEAYSGCVQLYGDEDRETIREASNYAMNLLDLRRFTEAKSLLRKVIPVARRVLTDSNEITLKMRWSYALSLYEDPDATLDDLNEAVTTLEDVGRIARRVLGGANPLTVDIERALRDARAALSAREGDDARSVCDGVATMTPGGA